jgi:hypothetical protein
MEAMNAETSRHIYTHGTLEHVREINVSHICCRITVESQGICLKQVYLDRQLKPSKLKDSLWRYIATLILEPPFHNFPIHVCE